MKKLLLCLYTACILSSAQAQIVGPATTTVGTPTAFSSPASAFTYHWDFSNVVLSPVLPSSLTTLLPAGSLNVPSYGCFVQDAAGISYYYVCEYNTGNIFCYTFPVFPGPPSATVLIGNYGAGLNLEGIDVVQDGGGHWYAIVVNSNNLIEIDLGFSLGMAGPFTSNVIPEPNFLWPHQVTVKQFDAASGGGWHAFVANRNGNITRVDFGATIGSLMNPAPAVTVLPNVGGVYTPCNFTLYYQDASSPHPGWYMLVPSLITADLTLYNFGSSLMNIPSGTILPHANGANLYRNVSIYTDCTGQLFALQFDETGDLIQYTFPGGDITNPPTPPVDLGPSGGYSLGSGAPAGATNGPNGINSFSFILPNFSSGEIDMYNPFMPLTPNSYCNYLVSTQNNTFTVPGPYSITLFYDMGRASGPSVACSQIDVTCKKPCYDEKQTIMSIQQSPTDPCTFTACVNVATSNTIAGYTWDVEPGGLIYTDPSGLPTNCFTFSLIPGTVYTVTVTVHIVDANLNCCEAVLSQQVQCGDNPGSASGNRMASPQGNITGDIQVYPNPTNGMVTVTSPVTAINSIQVYDVLGKKVSDNNYNAVNEADISLNNLPTGIYIVRVNNAVSKIVSKTE